MSVRLRAQRGVALVTAVMIVAIAAAVAAKIAFAHQLWFRQMENVADRGATDLLLRGALHYASVAVLEDAAQNSIDHNGEAWAQKLPTLPVDGGAIQISAEDAQGRFNLNNLVQNNVKSQADFDVFVRLMQNLKFDPQVAIQLANAVVDWIDPNSEVSSPGGAEDVDYLALKNPYRAANQPLVSVDELRLVRGFDAKILQALLPFVTALPGRTAININTAPPELLAAFANQDMAWAGRVVERRADKPMQNVSELTSLLPQGFKLPPNLADIKTSYFLVKLETSIGRHQRRTVALLYRDVNKTTKVIWHKPEPLIDAITAQSSSGSQGGNDENAELR